MVPMASVLRIIIVNGDEEYSAAIRTELHRLPGVQIVAEVDELAMIEQAVKQFPARVLFFNLDPDPSTSLPVAVKIAANNNNLAVIVLSECQDPQLIMNAYRSGIRDFLTKPIDRKEITRAIEDVARQIDDGHEAGQIITVMGTIGGVGASMLAANLAVELNQMSRDRPVAVVDLDFRFGQLATMFDIQADYTIADLCDTPEQLDDAVLDRAVVKHASGLHILARPNQFAQADMITAAHCASVLSSMQQKYKYIIVDGPMRFDHGGAAVLNLAGLNLFVIQLLVTSVRNVHRMFADLQDHGYSLDRFKLVCNRVGQESGHLGIEQVEKTLDRQISWQIPDDWRTVSSAINIGSPLSEIAPKSRICTAIREIAKHIVCPPDKTGTPPKSSSVKGGFLGRILSGAT